MAPCWSRGDVGRHQLGVRAMTKTLEQPIPTRPSHPRPYYETVIVSAGAPIVLSI